MSAVNAGLPLVTAQGLDFFSLTASVVYFRARCAPAQDLAPVNRRYFRSSREAERSGYRRSRTRGC